MPAVCVSVCLCGLICVCVCVSRAAAEDVLPSDPQLYRALSLPVFHIIDSCSDIDRQRRGGSGKIGV